MSLPKDLLYTSQHQWIKLDNNKATLGITFYGQMQLGQIVFVELPSLGKEIVRSQVIATIESSKAAVEVHSPLAGKVIEINQRLSKEAQLINTSPYGEGWICVLEMAAATEAQELLDVNAYQGLLESILGSDTQ